MTDLCIMLIMLLSKIFNMLSLLLQTRVFISLLYHIVHWISCGMEEQWVLRGKAVPLNDLIRVLNPDVVSISPVVLALTGCDTTNKFGTKKKVLHAVHAVLWTPSNFRQSCPFRSYELSGWRISFERVSNDKVEFFNNLRYIVYHKLSFGIDMVKLLPTSESIVLHMLPLGPFPV